MSLVLHETVRHEKDEESGDRGDFRRFEDVRRVCVVCAGRRAGRASTTLTLNFHNHHTRLHHHFHNILFVSNDEASRSAAH